MLLGNVVHRLIDVYGKDAVGIELEYEGGITDVLLSNVKEHNIKSWKITGDNSLRDGVELVTNNGIPFGPALEKHIFSDLPALLEGSSFKPTMRCGFHVHQDVTSLTCKEFAKLIVIYCLNEAALFEETGNRVSSNFCVPLFDCDLAQYADAIEALWLSGSVSELPNSDDVKYRALNVVPLWKFGTIEYRFMESTTSPEAIYSFISKIMSIKHLSKCDIEEFTPENLSVGGKFLLASKDRLAANTFYHERSRSVALMLTELIHSLNKGK